MSNVNRTIIEIHALETTAAGNLNRDDTGSPKTVEYGGFTRARVSSQAWKRPTRELFRELVDPKDLGVRTKHVVEELAGHIAERRPDWDAERTRGLAEAVLRSVGKKGIALDKPRRRSSADETGEEPAKQSQYLLFMGNRQYDRLADVAIEAEDTGDAAKALKADKKRIKQIVTDDRSIDVALFGRMVADDTDLNVDACAQVAHAISVQAVDSESDFFTAVDDRQAKGGDEGAGDAGAAMMGQIEFNAATFYRYANVDANRLCDTLGDASATAKAVAAFVRAFVTSMPQGKINTFAHGTLPDLVVVNLRDTQAVNLVGAFEKPVTPDYVRHATEALVRRERDLERAYGIEPVRTWVVRVGDDTAAADELAGGDGHAVSLRDAVSDVEQAILDRLAQE
ncbi:type I-E CRISPR-associated protein Cas7/Cse4/CasC [Bifidobacterium sp. MA2]|uniref:Type I-E CRISPR-associated protein Cas7/Cse4/CasC n=1 Tax=Bifidobacterium santillanense TaxID=2809028 RepID=A0ABS5UNH3_9BIFI|nr:type I-E CRISPR-associated protein Cas7/Cse4/CasC [Bifidobacterium santillanense]MBT1172412.1 type I-E CRISPR-associated protein Cas7/Cse4/CasC [Bifidobacterium santillanense]